MLRIPQRRRFCKMGGYFRNGKWNFRNMKWKWFSLICHTHRHIWGNTKGSFQNQFKGDPGSQNHIFKPYLHRPINLYHIHLITTLFLIRQMYHISDSQALILQGKNKYCINFTTSLTSLNPLFLPIFLWYRKKAVTFPKTFSPEVITILRI